MANTKQALNLACAMINTVAGDMEYNKQQMITLANQAQSQQVDILLFPELCITGYGAEDYFFYDAFIAKAKETLVALAKELPPQMLIIAGLPIKHQDGCLYNAAAIIYASEIQGLVCKRVLASSGIHYEGRWFTPWAYGRKETIKIAKESCPIGDININFSGLKIGFEICEDAWSGERPLLKDKSYDFILNPSASHYALGKQAIRRALVVDSSKKFSGVYAYSNLIGCEAGRIIYDGASFIAREGKLTAESERFVFTDTNLLVTNVVVKPKQQQVVADLTVNKGSFRASSNHAAFIADKISDECELLLAIARGLWDWMIKTKTQGFVVSLSGGADSALCAASVAISQFIALKTLGIDDYAMKLKKLGIEIDIKKHKTCALTIKEQVMPRLLTTAYQGTKNSSAQTREHANTLATSLGAKHFEWDIDEVVTDYTSIIQSALARELSWSADDITLQNIQARSRSPGIWMLANLENKLLMATSNLSEAVVGYCTMDGDTSGVLAPIGGLPKTRVLALLHTLGQQGFCFGHETLLFEPLLAISKQTPSAELRPSSQSDEVDLMPYEVLDKIRVLSQVDFLEHEGLLNKLTEHFKAQYKKPQLSQWYQRYQRLAQRSQWKRERLAPAFHLEEDSACPKTYRRWPIY